MVNNTPGGDDDFGAVGVSIGNSYNEVSYNRMVNCIASSYDYGTDGGAVELYGDVDGNYIHHNWAIDCDGFLEIGGGSAKEIILAYNVTVNNTRFSWVHNYNHEIGTGQDIAAWPFTVPRPGTYKVYAWWWDRGSVVVSDDASSGRDVVADAVRLVYVSPYSIYLPAVVRNS